jgi:hypothetical protein
VAPPLQKRTKSKLGSDDGGVGGSGLAQMSRMREVGVLECFL